MTEADDKLKVSAISLLRKSSGDKEVEDKEVKDKEVEDCEALFKLKEPDLVFMKLVRNTRNNYF